MFGFIKKNRCFYCEMEMPLLGNTCSYCGQKQTLPPQKSTSQLLSPPAPAAQTPHSQVIHQAPTQQTSHPAPTQKQKSTASLRFVFFLAWLGLFRNFIEHYMDGQPRGGINWEFYGRGLVLTLFLFFLSSARNLFLSFVSAIIMSISGLLLLLKPIISPHESSWQTATGEVGRHIFSYASETHLYYVIPGVILVFLAFIVFFSAVSRFLRRLRG